jgi:hypothetical protein
MDAVLNAAHDFIMNHRLLHHFGAGGVAVQVAQPMPQLDYEAAAFAPPRRPEYVAPPAAQKGFTRSPLEKDVIICPSCEEELVHNKGEDSEPVLKKNGKAPSRKEREEHPFWVLKECGHVNPHLHICCRLMLTSPGILQPLLSESNAGEQGH